MKVVMINGSPRKDSNTQAMLNDIAEELHHEGIDTQTFSIGTRAVHGCIACNKCFETHRCIFNDDICNRVIDAMQDADGLVIGSPVYYASANGALDALLDRIFYAATVDTFKDKVGAACVVCRRAGATASIDQLLKYFTISQMPVVSSVYWPMEHGRVQGETRQDEEGVYIMRRLGRNMAWLLKAIECGKEHGILPPVADEDRPFTNFVR